MERWEQRRTLDVTSMALINLEDPSTDNHKNRFVLLHALINIISDNMTHEESACPLLPTHHRLVGFTLLVIDSTLLIAHISAWHWSSA